MPTHEHEFLLELVQHRPSLVATLLAETGVPVPAYEKARLESCDLNDREPKEYRADSVVALVDGKGKPLTAVILEVQRSYDKSKHWPWPVYLATLRGRVKCPTVLLVFCPDTAEAHKCAEAIHMGHPDWVLRPIVLGPDNTPMITDIQRAIAEPELMALSSIVHGAGDQGIKILQVLFESQQHLAKEQQSYADFVLKLLPEYITASFKEAAVAVLDDIEVPWVRRWIDHGEARGEAKALLRILDVRGLPITDEARARIQECKDEETLFSWMDKAITATSIDEVFD
ncbi:hypothetical protein ACFOY2_51275 [Nonomuraea purpurea]|uniref:Rpn family recombination-promoting nuclease/putative transposase n=1 Tax=Nonomuraea purpurea TaxID=1849276 RepID=A0ABV8GPD5_9ACTN